jgi:hypothetical protein
VVDHCPLVLRYSSDDWGPKPFRFNNFLLQNSFDDWGVNTYGVMEEKKRHLIKGISDFDLKSVDTGLADVEVVERKLMFDELWKLLKCIDALVFQRSRHKWLKEGDANSRFFHSCIKAGRTKNHVLTF